MSPARPTQPIREEHEQLTPHIEALRLLGDSAIASEGSLDTDLQRSVDFLQRHLLIHAGAEERVLYPQVAELLGAPRATATMSRDHVEVERLTAELAGTPPTDRHAIARLAYGLYALVSVHFAKEEEIYLELMDATMSTAAVVALYERMEAAAAALKRGE